jgi:hypothetical protein
MEDARKGGGRTVYNGGLWYWQRSATRCWRCDIARQLSPADLVTGSSDTSSRVFCSVRPYPLTIHNHFPIAEEIMICKGTKCVQCFCKTDDAITRCVLYNNKSVLIKFISEPFGSPLLIISPPLLHIHLSPWGGRRPWPSSTLSNHRYKLGASSRTQNVADLGIKAGFFINSRVQANSFTLVTDMFLLRLFHKVPNGTKLH